MTNAADGALGSQIGPLRRPRFAQAIVRPVSEATFELRGGTDTFAAARAIVLNWIAARSGRPLPEEALRGESFELEEVGSQRTGAVAIDAPRYWAARLDDSDRVVAQRNWVTEIGIGETPAGTVLVGSRLLCVTRGQDVPYSPTLQTFIRRIAETFADVWVDGRQIGPTVWVARDKDDVVNLARLIERQSRRLTVIVCSLPEGSEDIGDCVIDAEDLHRRTFGAAHVVVLTSSASYILTNFWGREFSVFQGAVRSYRAGFNIDQDEPFRHPLAMPARIESWADGGPDTFATFLVSTALQAATAGGDSDRRVPSFATVRRIAAERRMENARSSGSSDVELLKLAEEEIAELKDAAKKDRETYEGLVAQYELDRDQAREESEQALAAQAHLRQRVRGLVAQIADRVPDAAAPAIPSSLEPFEEWCRANLSGAVEVHNRAMQGVKKSQYENVDLVYRALLLLRDQYVAMRRQGGLELRLRFDAACNELGLAEEASFSGTRHGEQGEEYFVRHAGRRTLLDRHLKKGNSREPRHCFRLYFFWDDENEQVVVGWLPSHLDTRIS